jgi:hypothetical protein
MAGYAFESLRNLLVNSSIDWADNRFDKKKAYVMSLFSALAYEHLPKYEIDYRRRAKSHPVPCISGAPRNPFDYQHGDLEAGS